MASGLPNGEPNGVPSVLPAFGCDAGISDPSRSAASKIHVFSYSGRARRARTSSFVSDVLRAGTRRWRLDAAPSWGIRRKSERACRTYSRIGKDSHWRKQKITAAKLLKAHTRHTPHEQPDPTPEPDSV